ADRAAIRAARCRLVQRDEGTGGGLDPAERTESPRPPPQIGVDAHGHAFGAEAIEERCDESQPTATMSEEPFDPALGLWSEVLVVAEADQRQAGRPRTGLETRQERPAPIGALARDQPGEPTLGGRGQLRLAQPAQRERGERRRFGIARPIPPGA